MGGRGDEGVEVLAEDEGLRGFVRGHSLLLETGLVATRRLSSGYRFDVRGAL